MCTTGSRGALHARWLASRQWGVRPVEVYLWFFFLNISLICTHWNIYFEITSTRHEALCGRERPGGPSSCVQTGLSRLTTPTARVLDCWCWERRVKQGEAWAWAAVKLQKDIPRWLVETRGETARGSVEVGKARYGPWAIRVISRVSKQPQQAFSSQSVRVCVGSLMESHRGARAHAGAQRVHEIKCCRV